MTLWVIGFLFTVGYTGWLKAKLPWWKSFGALFAILAVWPLFLGMEFGGCFDDDTANTDSTSR